MRTIIAKKPLRTLAVSGLMLTLTACSVSTDYDRKIGAENAAAVEAQMGTYDRNNMQAYVQQIGARLVSHIDNPEFTFEFHIVDDAAPNAFALPGGYIFISRGLLSLVNNEDELACVMAHEIIHVTQRHSIKQMQSSVLPSIIELPGNIVGGVINEDLGNLINAPITTGNSLLMAGYSRGHESEADKLGIQLAAKAGYDPLAMNSILSRLNQTVEIETEHPSERSYFDSHPFTPDRIADVTSEAKTLSVADISPIHQDFVSQIAGLVVGDNPNKGLFRDSTFLQPEMKFVIDFPEKWVTLNQASAVAAINKKQDAAVVLSLASNEFTAKQHAMRFSNEIQRRYGVELDVDEQALEWGSSLYSVTLTNEEKGANSYMTRSWINLGIDTYQLITIAPENTRATVDKSAQTFRPITDEELASIKQLEVKIVQAKAGDTLDDLIKQNDSQSPAALLAVMNALDETEHLEPNQKVKLVVEADYL
ncbi:peptidase [Vibrio sp. UCD-FRSSP16_10]|uniref:M48 family metalloprotease n=1 Tax=unclassified Vibrio TaxID=2614977 RepID=UPI0008023D4C|nr:MULTISPECIES: M48 family metalloprotease [unclassified Vibrio]OBT13984.1 peptidase [Vibrio sp. UCD-FRSSP16_30]OBT22865.1 peptidase [Vibrio sp. UCD-FRSSP16_10]